MAGLYRLVEQPYLRGQASSTVLIAALLIKLVYGRAPTTDLLRCPRRRARAFSPTLRPKGSRHPQQPIARTVTCSEEERRRRRRKRRKEKGGEGGRSSKIAGAGSWSARRRGGKRAPEARGDCGACSRIQASAIMPLVLDLDATGVRIPGSAGGHRSCPGRPAGRAGISSLAKGVFGGSLDWSPIGLARRSAW